MPWESRPAIMEILGAIYLAATELVLPGGDHLNLLKSDKPNQVSSMFNTVFLVKSIYSKVSPNCCLRILFLSELPCQEICCMRLYRRLSSFFMMSLTIQSFTYKFSYSFRCSCTCFTLPRCRSSSNIYYNTASICYLASFLSLLWRASCLM